MQDLQAHFGIEGDGGGEGEEGERQIWHVDFAEGGFRNVHFLQGHEKEEEEDILLGSRYFDDEDFNGVGRGVEAVDSAILGFSVLRQVAQEIRLKKRKFWILSKT